MILRYSALQTLKDCPRKFYKSYVQGIEEPATEAKDMGSAVHDVLERWHKDPFLDVEEACRKEVKRYDTLFPTYEETLKEVIIMARTFLKYFEPELASTHTEQRIKVQLGKSGHVITGSVPRRRREINRLQDRALKTEHYAVKSLRLVRLAKIRVQKLQG
ncbi:MAG: PD-(D/E)XK nuclease family protein [Clostridiales bacterium]|nr:PD-(D/E)XK nuclease family protein [Clostridiales bacterium]MCF8023669.1 PD-(D/E)XK nuclease family protein [Clostridiales bacterium]